MKGFEAVRKFGLRAAAFVLPLCLLWCGAVYASGESLSYDAVIARQLRDTSAIYGPAYSMNNHAYRSAFTRAVRPKTLIIGDSRVSLVRNWFFSEPETVYNACWGAITPAEVQYFLENQPGGSIETVIFSLSHFDFNQNYLDMEYPSHDEYSNPSWLKPLGFGGASTGVLEDWKQGRLGLLDLLLAGRERLGVSAIEHEAGILCDGSFFSAADNAMHAKQTAGGAQGHLGGSLEMIHTGTGRFVPGYQVNPRALEYLEGLLAWCAERDILVIGFLPPYAPTVNDALAEKREEYAYHYELPGLAAPLFEAYGHEFYDYTDVTPLGCDDSWFVDGYHAGDPVWLRMMADMADRGSALGQMCDVAFLRELEAGRYANHLLYNSLEEYQRPMPAYPAAAE